MHVHSENALTRSRGGLTLLEVTLAFAILAMVMSVVYSSLRAASHSLQSLSVRNELYRSAYGLLDEMGRELAGAYLSTSPIPGRAKTYFYVEDREMNGMAQDNLYFTTFGHAMSSYGMGESDQAEVCYTVHYSQSREELILFKKEDTTLDEVTCQEESLEDLDQPLAERPVPVASGVHPERGVGYRLVGFNVEAFRSGMKDPDPDPDWNSNETRRLPARVRVTLTYKDASDHEIPFSKSVLVRMADRAVQQPNRATGTPNRGRAHP